MGGAEVAMEDVMAEAEKGWGTVGDEAEVRAAGWVVEAKEVVDAVESVKEEAVWEEARGEAALVEAGAEEVS